MLGYAGWYSGGIYRDILFYVPFQQVLLIPPVLFFYVRSLLDNSFAFRSVHWLHFLPAAGYLLYSVIIFCVDQFIADTVFFYADQKDKDFAGWYQWAGFFSLLFYLGACLRIYRSYRRETTATLSFADDVRFRWVQHFLVALAVLTLLRGLFFIINPEWDQFGKKFWYYCSFSVLLYYISISGYSNAIRSLISLSPNSGHSFRAVLVLEKFEPPLTRDNIVKNTPESIDITEEEAGQYRLGIEHLMDQLRYYEKPALTIAEMAAPLGMSPKKLSQVIRHLYDVSFNDFVNQRRVTEVVKKIKSGEHSLQTLTGIALDCGFNSKSTFNRAFKRWMGETPRDFIKKMSGK